MADVEVLLRAVGKVYLCYGTPVGLSTCNTVLIKSEGKNILVDPGHFSFRSLVPKRLAEKQLALEDVEMVINTHLHFDHFANNHLFRGCKLFVHERELESARQRYWPEMMEAFVNLLEVQPISKDVNVTSDVRIVETFGHTSGSVSVLADTPNGLVVVAGDAVILTEDFVEKKAPMFSENPKEAKRSIEKIRKLKPSLIIPGHDEPFRV